LDRAVKHMKYNKNGGVDLWEEFTYDEFGNKTEMRKCNADGSLYRRYVYEYGDYGARTNTTIYDVHGNIVTE